jgi:hypothetical protein
MIINPRAKSWFERDFSEEQTSPLPYTYAPLCHYIRESTITLDFRVSWHGHLYLKCYLSEENS